MPPITAVVHTHNDGLRLGRCLETLFPCDDALIIDHGSHDATLQVAREYGATIITGKPTLPNEYLRECLRPINSRWILCLYPRESLTESLAASLYEWKTGSLPANVPAFSMFLREETAHGWIEYPTAQTRLVPASWLRWQGEFPAMEPLAVALEGDILRFAMP